MKKLTLSNLFYTSAFTIALGVSAPLVLAGSHAMQDADSAQHEMDPMDPMDHMGNSEKKTMEGHSHDSSDNVDGPDVFETGATGAGSDIPGAPAHVPDGDPDHDHDVE